jgi:hypothetical protein
MRTNAKRYEILRALELQKRTQRPSLTLSTRPTTNFPGLTEPLNKSARAKKRPMEEAEKLEIVKRTGSTPYLEVMFK